VSFRFLKEHPELTDHSYNSLESILAAAQLDIVVIATPWTWRLLGIKLALEANCHVMVENPLAMNLKDCDAILDLVAQFPDLQVCVNEQWRWLSSVGPYTFIDLPDSVDYGRLRAVRLTGKGRNANVELSRIMTHLLSIVHKYLIVEPFQLDRVNWLNVQSMEATLMTQDGILVELDLLQQTTSDVRNCALELVYERGRVRLSGGFLETINYIAGGVQAGRVLSLTTENWESIDVTNAWLIQPGDEQRALLDTVMNPSFGLWEDFMGAIVSGDAGENPFPPIDFLPVCQTLDLLAQAKDAGGFATTIW